MQQDWQECLCFPASVKDPFKCTLEFNIAKDWPRLLSTCARCNVNLPGFPPFPVSSEKFFTNSMVSGFSLFLSASDSPLGWALRRCA